MNARLLYSLLIALTSLPIMAQVGINSIDPKATMDIEAIETNSSTAEGLIAPRLTGDQIRDKDAQYGTDQTGTLIYASAAVTSSPSAKTINIDAPGYYFFDGSIWLKVAAGVDDTNLATTNLTQDAETRTYDLNSQDLNFTNGSFGINKPNPNGQLDVEGTRNEDAFRFTQTNNLTGEKDVFTIEDQDVGGGGQDHSSVLKVLKSGSINPGDDGFSLIELASTSSDPGANKYWISGRTVDEGAPLWGVDITDNDFWSAGGIQLGALPSSNGTYTGGNFRVNANGDTGIGTVNPNARLQIDEDSADLDHIIFQINTSSGRPLNILQPDVTDINTPFTFQTNNAFNFRTDNTDALTILNTSQLALPSYVGNFQNETPTRILGLDAAGNVISSAPVIDSDADWFTSNTTTAPASIDDNIWTNGNVGIGTNNPASSLHIVEATGNAGSAANGSITLEHGNAGGASSIVFKSRVNNNSDYGYIRFEDDGSGNGTTDENAILTIGIENDGTGQFQDDINLNPAGAVGVQTNSPDGSSSLTLGRNDRGLLLNRVALLATDNGTSPINNPASGLFVYNTATNGSGNTRVQPGLYYWNNGLWNRVFDRGFTIQYNQTNEARAASSTSTYVDLPGLVNNVFVPPISGTYQIILNAYHSSGSPLNSTVAIPLNQNNSFTTTVQQDAASQGSIRVRMNNATIGEKYVTSVSKSFPGQSFYSLGQNLTIIMNVDLVAGTSYDFDVQGREWARYNADRGFFGRTTAGVYVGNGGVNAQYGDLTITLIKEN